MSVGVVLMAYGTPASADDVEDYYTHIRRGRPPTVEQLDELRARYAAIGGVSPMARHTAAQVAAIDAALQASEPGRFEVSLGQKHAAPFVEDAVEELTALGADRVVGLVLAPHWSSSSIGVYHDRARRVTEEHRIRYDGIDSWSDEPAFIDHQARAVLRRLAELPERTKVLFTAHSLPLRVLDGDPYPDQLRASATAIAEQAGLARWAGWSLAWQSAGRTPEPWAGPDVREVIRELAATGRTDGVLVVPQGFTSQHLEVLHDLDIEAAGVAEHLGLHFARTDVIDDDADVMRALAGRISAIADSFPLSTVSP